MSGGRHKVFGHPALHIIPQTSTIASHLPRAVGLGFALGLAEAQSRDTPWPEDAVVVCSFGDASANHSTAAGALNAAAYLTHLRRACPVLFVCEDNGIGISTRTPRAGPRRRSSSSPASRTSTQTATGRSISRRDRGGTGHRTVSTLARRAAPEHRPLHGPRGLGRRDRLPLAGGDPGRLRARPSARARRVPSSRAVTGARPPWWSATSRSVPGPADGPADRPRGAADHRAEVMAPLAHAPQRRRGRAEPGRPPPDPTPRTLAQAINATLAQELEVHHRRAGLRRGRRGQGRRLRRHPRAARKVRRRPASSTPCSTSRPSSAPRSAPAWPASSRCPRSSTSPTCTTPRTSCAARRPPCASSPTGSTTTGWWSGSRGSPTRRGSAATSTTTTRWPYSATSPARGGVPSHPHTAPGAASHLPRPGPRRGAGLRVRRTHREVPHA